MNALLEAKKKYKYLYLLRFEQGHIVVFRGLTLAEYRDYISLINTFPILAEDLKDELFTDCVIEYSSDIISYKKNGDISSEELLTFIYAGVVESVVQAILQLGGANDIDKLMGDIADGRSIAMNNVYDRILYLVASLFKYKIEDLEQMYWTDIIRIINQGELIMSGNIPATPFDVSPVQKSGIDFNEENKKIYSEYNS